MKKTDLAYIAGIFDGEGCITFQKSKSHPQSVFVELTNTNEWIVRQFYFWFGGSFRNWQSQPHWKVTWRWVAQGEGGVKFLELILPYLKLKRPQAELAIQFQNQKRAKTLTNVVEEATKVAMSHFNKRGV